MTCSMEKEHLIDGSRAYVLHTKRALVILTELWAEQLENSGVVVHAMTSGWADTPGVAGSLPGFHTITRRLLRTAEQGADTVTWLAAAPEAAKVSGVFWLSTASHTRPMFFPAPILRRRGGSNYGTRCRD